MNARPSPDADVAEHLRTQFLRRVAHDIASPTGVTLTVLDELANGDRPRPELLAMARRSLRRLMRLSEHLALVAELEGGSFEPEVAAVDVRALTKQAVDDALAIDGRKDVVAASTMPSSPVFVDGDGRLLLLVFREIIGNALKLASSRVEVSLTHTNDEIAVRVDDDGPGFSRRLGQDARPSLHHASLGARSRSLFVDGVRDPGVARRHVRARIEAGSPRADAERPGQPSS